jgi:hypothetical protein
MSDVSPLCAPKRPPPTTADLPDPHSVPVVAVLAQDELGHLALRIRDERDLCIEVIVKIISSVRRVVPYAKSIDGVTGS